MDFIARPESRKENLPPLVIVAQLLTLQLRSGALEPSLALVSDLKFTSLLPQRKLGLQGHVLQDWARAGIQTPFSLDAKGQ